MDNVFDYPGLPCLAILAYGHILADQRLVDIIVKYSSSSDSKQIQMKTNTLHNKLITANKPTEKCSLKYRILYLLILCRYYIGYLTLNFQPNRKSY